MEQLLEQLQLDLNDPTTLGAIAAVAALIVIGIIIGFVRGRKKRAISEPPPAPDALEEKRPKIDLQEALEEVPEAESSRPSRSASKTW